MAGIILVSLVVFFFFASVILRRDEWAVILLIFLLNDLFYLVPQEQLHVENVGKVSDLGLILGVGSLLLVRRYRLALPRLWSNRVGKMIIFLGLLVAVAALGTAIRYGSPLIYAFRIGRLYLFYLLFFSFGGILAQRHSTSRVRGKLLGVFVVLAIGYILQTFLPVETLFYPTYSTSYTLGGFALNRTYLGYLEFYAGLFAIFVFIQYVLMDERKLSQAQAFILFIVQIALTRHRNLWMTTILGMMFASVMMGKAMNVRVSRSLKRLALLATVVILIGASTGLTGFVTDRFSAGLDDSPLAGGTLSGRLVASERYLSLLFDNWFFGVGLVHSETGVFQTTDEMDYFSELGSIGFIFHFGIAGIIWISMLGAGFHRLVKTVLGSAGVGRHDAAFVVAGYGFFFGTLVMSFLNPGFSMPGGIAVLTFLMAYAESIGITSQHQEIITQ
jgi:hypothetical protein